MQTFYKICLLLLIVGGVNWGLVGLFQFDLVGWLLGGSTSVWSRIVFALVGLAALGCIPESVQRGTGGRITKRLLHFCVQQPFVQLQRFSSDNKKRFLRGLLVVIHIVPANEVGQGQGLVRAVVACAALVGSLGVHYLAGKLPDGNAVLRQVGLAAAGVGEQNFALVARRSGSWAKSAGHCGRNDNRHPGHFCRCAGQKSSSSKARVPAPPPDNCTAHPAHRR